MSQRTIVEFNHDYAHTINTRLADEFIMLLIHALGTGGWEPMKQYGIRRIVTAHHSDKRHVVVNDHIYKYEPDQGSQGLQTLPLEERTAPWRSVPTPEPEAEVNPWDEALKPIAHE